MIEQSPDLALACAFAQTPPRTLMAGSRIGSGLKQIHRLRRGWACRLHEWPDAKQAITDVYLPGDLLGLAAVLSDGPEDTIVAANAVMIETLDAEVLLERPQMTLWLARLLVEQQRRIGRLLAAIARLDARRRVALMLLEFCERLGNGATALLSFHLPLTQAQIGDHLGLTLVHVNRVLRSLRDERIVEVNRHVVVIRDLDRLGAIVAGIADDKMADRKGAAGGEDLGHAAAVADLPVGLVAD